VLSKHASQNSPSILHIGSCTRHVTRVTIRCKRDKTFGGGRGVLKPTKIIELCVVGMGPLEE